MAANVRINLPPRLIESARAAQYTNRAALDARVLDQKVEDRAAARYGAIQRAAAESTQPLPNLVSTSAPQLRPRTTSQGGGILEFSSKPAPRIRLPRRRQSGFVTVGAYWFLLIQRQIASRWNVQTWCWGSIDGQHWRVAQFTEMISGANPFLFPEDQELGCVELPAGGAGVVVLCRIVRRSPFNGAFIGVLSTGAYLIRPDGITEVSVSGDIATIISAIQNRSFNAERVAYVRTNNGWRAKSIKTGYSVFVRRPDLYVPVEEAIEEYRQYTGDSSAEIPVIGIDRTSEGSNVGSSGPESYPATIETHGIIDNITFSSMLPALPIEPPVTPSLTDETPLELAQPIVIPSIALQEIAQGGAVLTTQNSDSVMASGSYPGISLWRQYVYDYYGGTYCRDKLQALGITLP